MIPKPVSKEEIAQILALHEESKTILEEDYFVFVGCAVEVGSPQLMCILTGGRARKWGVVKGKNRITMPSFCTHAACAGDCGPVQRL